MQSRTTVLVFNVMAATSQLAVLIRGWKDSRQSTINSGTVFVGRTTEAVIATSPLLLT